MDDREVINEEPTVDSKQDMIYDREHTKSLSNPHDQTNTNKLARSHTDIVPGGDDFRPPELEFDESKSKYTIKKKHHRLASVGDAAQNKMSQWRRNSRPSNFHSYHRDEKEVKLSIKLIMGMFRDHSIKVFALIVLAVVTCIYFFAEDLQNDQLWGWEVWRILALLGLWGLYEILRVVEIIFMFLFEKLSHWGFWKRYLIISACDRQITLITWAVLGEYLIEFFLKLNEQQKGIGKSVLACIVIACIALSVRNLVLRRLFWTVHQKKLSQRMHRFNDLEDSLRFLLEKFVVNRESFDAASAQGEHQEHDSKQLPNHPVVDHQDTLSDASYLDALAKIKEFEKKRKDAMNSHKTGKMFKLKSRSQAAVYAKALNATLDHSEQGYISLNKIQKVMPEKLFMVFQREIKGHYKLAQPSADHHHHSTIETRFFDHRERKQSKDTHHHSAHISVPVDLPVHSNEHHHAHEHDEEADIHITEPLLRTVFESLYVLGDALAKSSTSWSELSHGLQLLVDVIMWIFVIIVCSLYLGVNWSTLLVTTSTLVICAAFTVGAAISRLVLSMIFIFMTNPYEIGDTVAFETPNSDFYVVEQINVFSTLFKTEQNHKVVIANWKLAEAVVFNLSRNRVSKIDLYFQMPANVSVQKFKWIRKEIAKFLKSHPDYYFPEFWMVTHDVPYSQNILMQVRVSVKSSFEDSIALSLRRTEVLNCIKDNLSSLEIPYQFAESPYKKKDFFPFRNESEKTPDTQGHASIHLTPTTGMAGGH